MPGKTSARIDVRISWLCDFHALRVGSTTVLSCGQGFVMRSECCRLELGRGSLVRAIEEAARGECSTVFLSDGYRGLNLALWSS